MHTDTASGVVLHDVGDTLGPLATYVNVSAVSIATILAARQVQDYYWANSTARTAQTGMLDGAQGYESDTKSWYQYNGTTSAWGLIYTNSAVAPIVPTVLGTGVTVDATGLVSFSSTTVITVDNALPTVFRKHKISLQTLNNTGTAVMVLRTSAPADDTNAKYDRTELIGRNATASSTTTASAASWPVASQTTALVEAEIELVGAAIASPTTGFMRLGQHANPAVSGTTNLLDEMYLTQQESTAFAGFKITFTAGCSGTIRVTGEI